MKKGVMILFLLFLPIFTYANIFGLEIPPGVAPGAVCLKTGCNMSGDIYMNNNTIYDATFINATVSGSINSSDVVNPIWVNRTGDTMTGDLDMNGNSLLDVLFGYFTKVFSNDWSNVTITESQITDLVHTIDTDTHVEGDGFYLTNDSSTMFFDESKLNNTIDNKLSNISSSNIEDIWVNITGDKMIGPLNMTNGSITNVYFLGFENNETFFRVFRNGTNATIQLWVNGVLQQDWGSSTTIYGEATFLDNAFFQNIFLQEASGDALFINTSVIVGQNMSVNGWLIGNGTHITDICHSNGTGCNFNATDVFNLSTTDTHIAGDNVFLYDDYNTMYFNETRLNNSMSNFMGVREEYINISVSGGIGINTTSVVAYSTGEILEVAVYPISSANTYRFSANGTTSGDAVDTNRISHTGDWVVAHRGTTLINDSISAFISSASIDEVFTVRIRWRI